MNGRTGATKTPKQGLVGTLQRWLLVTAGVISVGLAVVGIFLPLVPTTAFLLLAAACFIRSSDKLYQRLITNRWLGPYIRNYREHKAITRRAKILALVLLWGTIGYSAIFVAKMLVVRILLFVVAACVTAHLLSLKTMKKETLADNEAARSSSKAVKDP